MTEVLLRLPAAVVTTVFSYWPACAVPWNVYFQSSPGSSSPFLLVSPTLKPSTRMGVGVEVVGGVGGRAVVVGDGDVLERLVARVGDVVGPGHRAADLHAGTRRGEGGLAVGLLGDGDHRRGGEVVAEAVGRDRGVADVTGGRGHDGVLVLAGLGGPSEGVLPVLARVEQAVLVGVADVEAARPGRAWG